MQTVSFNQKSEKEGTVQLIFLPDIQAGSKLILILPSSSRAKFHTLRTDLLSRSARCASQRCLSLISFPPLEMRSRYEWTFCKLIVTWWPPFCLMSCDVYIDTPNRRRHVAFQPCAAELRPFRIGIRCSSSWKWWFLSRLETFTFVLTNSVPHNRVLSNRRERLHFCVATCRKEHGIPRTSDTVHCTVKLIYIGSVN
jgi:hypothetical protein